MTKEQERQELHRAIWAIANELRGSVDGWDFKSYVLGFLFYRFISEDLTNYINKGEWESGNDSYDYLDESDDVAVEGKEDIVQEKGYFILPSQLFRNIRKNAKDDENLNVTLAGVFDSIEASANGTASEADFKGLFDDIDVNSKKLGNTVAERNSKLVKILDRIGELKLGDLKDNTIDAFGDAYEFLMTMYASNAGKSGGEFFTPQEVSELLARIVTTGKTQVNKVYDPACGSGSLLLKFAKLLGSENVLNGFYGQEINITTYNLARINMILHNVGFEKFDIALGDTLINPAHWDDEPFDLIVSNPPYIPSNVVDTLEPEVREYEPRIALDGTEDGLKFYRILAEESPKYLNTGGHVVFEIGYDQGEAVAELLKAAGFRDVMIIKDYGGNDRVVTGHL